MADVKRRLEQLHNDNDYNNDKSNNQKNATLQLHSHPYRWLGDTGVNQLVRQAIETYSPVSLNGDIRNLDAGCGVGGTLYALLPDTLMQVPTSSKQKQPQDAKSKKTTPSKAKSPRRQFSYHGIAISAAEVHHA